MKFLSNLTTENGSHRVPNLTIWPLNLAKSQFLKNEVFEQKNKNFEILKKICPGFVVRTLYMKFHFNRTMGNVSNHVPKFRC